MDLQLTNKTALITGASAGIGKAIARGLAAEGGRLCVAARRGELLEKLSREITNAGGFKPMIAVIDLMEEDAPQRLAQKALQELGQIDILVNCAGGSRRVSIDAPDEEWTEAVMLNFTRLRQLTHAVLPGMIEKKWGRVINITGKSEPAHLNAANPSKAAVHAWAKGLSREIGKYGITVNSIQPGRIMSEQVLRNHPEQERREFSERSIPVGRFGEPDELACLAVFLASPIACYITGTVIPVDGGLRRYAF
jgi:3-oxoacyl-[acyl-carrier protein] reductase